jgi:hypothetical protein
MYMFNGCFLILIFSLLFLLGAITLPNWENYNIVSLRIYWSNIEKWRNLLKIGRGILKLLPFKVSGYFTRVLMRNGAMVA